MRDDGVNPDTAVWAIVALTRLAGSYALVLGVVFSVGGRDRMVGPSWQATLQVPGSPASWGVALAVIGVLILIGSLRVLRLRVVCLWLSAVWHLFFAGSFLLPLIEGVRGAAVTGVIAYGLIAVIHVVLAVAQRPEQRSRGLVAV